MYTQAEHQLLDRIAKASERQAEAAEKQAKAMTKIADLLGNVVRAKGEGTHSHITVLCK